MDGEQCSVSKDHATAIVEHTTSSIRAQLRTEGAVAEPLNWELLPMPAYCEVALPVPLDRTFTYALHEGEQVARGARVIAPFRNEKLIGVVTTT